MKLDYYYNLNEDDILREIEKENKIANENILKMQGYRYVYDEKISTIISWQSMKIHFGTHKIDTHILLRIMIDDEDNIKDIELYKDFIGSQGEKCKYNVLNEHIKKVFINEKLSLRNLKIKDAKVSWCRHIYELMYGSAYFLLYAKSNKLKNTFYFEKNYLKPKLNSFSLTNEINLNNDKSVFRLDISKIANTKLDLETCKIMETDPIVIEAKLNGKQIIEKEEIYSKTNEEFYQNLLKKCQKLWEIINKNMKLDNIFTFTILWPTTLFSYIVQLLTIYISKGRNNALNRCLANFQRKDGIPICIGFLLKGEKMDDNI